MSVDDKVFKAVKSAGIAGGLLEGGAQVDLFGQSTMAAKAEAQSEVAQDDSSFFATIKERGFFDYMKDSLLKVPENFATDAKLVLDELEKYLGGEEDEEFIE